MSWLKEAGESARGHSFGGITIRVELDDLGFVVHGFNETLKTQHCISFEQFEQARINLIVKAIDKVYNELEKK